MAKDKEKVRRGIVYNFTPEFPHPSLKIEDLQPAIIEGVFVPKKGDRVLIERFDSHDRDANKDRFTLDICTVISFDEPNDFHADKTISLLDDTRGDNYGIDPSNPPRCGILTDEHMKKTRGKKKRNRRNKNVDQNKETSVTEEVSDNVTEKTEVSE